MLSSLLEILKILYEIISGKLCNIKILVYHIISHKYKGGYISIMFIFLFI
jgi:hypothetical protein